MSGVGLSIPEVAARGRGGNDPATDALIARMSVAPSGPRAGLIDALVRALKGAGIWAKLDLLHVMAAHDAQAARLNWLGSSYTLSAVNSPAFTVDRGYAGNGTTQYLDTGFQPGVTSGQAAQNSNHIGLWCRTASGGAAVEMGSTNLLIQVQNSGNMNSRNMAGTPQVVAVSDGLGHSLISRTASGSYARYRGGASLGGAVQPSATPLALNLFLLADNIGSATAYSARQLAVAHAGSGLSAGEAAAMQAALSAYLVAVGAA